MHRRHLLLATAALLGAATTSLATTGAADAASLGEIAVPFTPAAFAAAQAAGKPILVHIWASWCPTCAKQTPTLATLAGDPAFKDMAVFRVDFDAQKDVVRQFGARMQSTLIVFHGSKETGRAVGETAPGAIRALLLTGLG